MNKFEKQAEKRKSLNNKNWIDSYSVYLISSLAKVKQTTEKWFNRMPSNDKSISSWFTKFKQSLLQQNISKDMKDDLKAIEKFIEDRYNAEYVNAWYNKAYVTVQNGIQAGYNFKISKTNSKLLKDRIENALSKFMDRNAMNADRAKYISRVYRSIKTGIQNNKKLDVIFNDLDKIFGVRDAKTGKLIIDATKYKGIAWDYRRLLLTEIGRIQSDAEADEYIKEIEQGVKSSLVYRSAFLPTSREQSMSMDGQVANEEGKFKYPNGVYYRQHNTGNPAWDINDYCFTDKRDYEFPAKYRLLNDTVVKTENVNEYVKSIGLKVDKHNQIKEPKKTVKKK